MRLVLLSIFLVMKAWVCRNVKGSLSVANSCFVGSKPMLCRNETRSRILVTVTVVTM